MSVWGSDPRKDGNPDMANCVDYDLVIQEWISKGSSIDVVDGYVEAVASHVSPRWAKAIKSCFLRPLTEVEKQWISQVRGDMTRIKDNVDTRYWVSFWGTTGPESEATRDTHTAHCCVDHGCKYGDEDCPVEKGTKIQSFTCPYCSRDESQMW